MKIEIGQQAPSFSLYDTDKKKVSLDDFKGKTVVLLFFPQAFTSTCTRELCSVRDDIGHYQNDKVDVIGISVDSAYTLKKYKELERYNFPLLSDFNKDVSEAYGALYKEWFLEMKGVSKRASFVIDKNGIIRFAEVLENAGDFPDFEGINNTVASLS